MWTVESALEYMKALFREKDLRDQQRFEAQTEGVAKALAELKAHLAAMNEFRGQMKDQSASFLTKDAFDAFAKMIDAQTKSLQEQIHRLNDAMLTNTSKRQGAVSVYTVVTAIVALIATALGIWANLKK